MHTTDHMPCDADKRYLALDGWRGICAIIVAVLHFHTTGTLSNLGVIAHGYLFVDFFFLLSGFVLTHAYLHRLENARDAGWMIWRRLGRLWPLHMAVLLAFIALELAAPMAAWLTGLERSAQSAFDPSGTNLIEAIPTNVFFLHGLGIHDRLTWNIPSWSISVEFWTYAIFALVVLSGPKRTMMSAVILVGLGAILVAEFSPNFMAVENGLGFFRCLAGFFAGHIAYRLLAFAPARLPWATLSESTLAVGVFVFVAAAGGTAFELAAPIVFAATVWLFAQEQGGVSRLLKSRPLQALGLWSYSIYMVHSLLIAVAHRVASVLEKSTGLTLIVEKTTPEGVQTALAFAAPRVMDLVTLAYVAALILVSALTWRFIEVPSGRHWNSTMWLAITGRRAIASSGSGVDDHATTERTA